MPGETCRRVAQAAVPDSLLLGPAPVTRALEEGSNLTNETLSHFGVSFFVGLSFVFCFPRQV